MLSAVISSETYLKKLFFFSDTGFYFGHVNNNFKSKEFILLVTMLLLLDFN